MCLQMSGLQDTEAALRAARHASGCTTRIPLRGTTAESRYCNLDVLYMADTVSCTYLGGLRPTGNVRCCNIIVFEFVRFCLSRHCHVT